MDGWTDGWMDGQKDTQLDRQIDRYFTHKHISKRSIKLAYQSYFPLLPHVTLQLLAIANFVANSLIN